MNPSLSLSPTLSSSESALEKNNRILVVDDNEAIHADFRKILCNSAVNAELDADEAMLFGETKQEMRRASFDLQFASQGVEALELVKKAVAADKRYAMVFMDVRMPPGWDGLETTLKLWEVDPDLQIVICTAYSDYSWEEMMGMIRSPERLLILNKPFDNIEVLQFAHALTEKWALVQAARHNTELLEATVCARTQELLREIEVRRAVEKQLRVANAEAEAANRTKSEFLANMSHEIRTPMNGIMGMTELVLDTELSSQQREYLGIIKQSSESLLEIINDILDFAKIEAGKLELDSIGFDLQELISEVVKPLGIRADQKHVEIVADIPSDVPCSLIGDPGRLRQVLINLVGNAVKFTNRGEISLEVRCQERTADSVSLRFTVRDTGIGIAPEVQRAIFSAFVQADGSMTRRFGGTGLGLAISSGLVKQMGGAIAVESAPGQGSCFEFSCRLQLDRNPKPTESLGNRELLRGMSVLIVDDNETNRRVLESTTAGWGMSPVAAASGADALRKFDVASVAGNPFRLVLLDAMMPEMDGFTVAEEIQKRTAGSPVTVLMLSSAGHNGQNNCACRAGISRMLTKPVLQRDLLAAVLSTLAKAAEASANHSADPVAQTDSPLRVLVVDDNLVNQEVTRTFLAMRGHDVVVASSGEQGVRAVTYGDFDIVLMDVQMPEMDGLQATALIRTAEEKFGKRILIVALTARAMKGDAERCVEVGMDGYLSKPFSRAALVSTVETAVRNAKLQLPHFQKTPPAA